MSSLQKRVLMGLVLAVLVLVGMGIYADVRELQGSLSQFNWNMLFPALALALGNYLFRFLRWHIYLRWLHLGPVRFVDSFAIFWAGLVMSITPGKVGELLKSFLLRDRAGVSVAQSAPVVVAERLTDFISVLLLCLAGAMSTQYGLEVIVVAAVVCLGAIVVISTETLARRVLALSHRIPLVRRVAPGLETAYQSMRDLVRMGPLLTGIALGVIAWGLECVALYMIVDGFPGVDVDLGRCVFIYAFATLAGAVTMLPGGLVFTEGSMIALLHTVAAFQVTSSRAVATAVTVLVRFCTLWFAVALGVIAMAWLQRTGASFQMTQTPSSEQVPSEQSASD